MGCLVLFLLEYPIDDYLGNMVIFDTFFPFFAGC